MTLLILCFWIQQIGRLLLLLMFLNLKLKRNWVVAGLVTNFVADPNRLQQWLLLMLFVLMLLLILWMLLLILWMLSLDVDLALLFSVDLLMPELLLLFELFLKVQLLLLLLFLLPFQLLLLLLFEPLLLLLLLSCCRCWTVQGKRLFLGWQVQRPLVGELLLTLLV